MRVWVSGARGKLGAEVCRQLRRAGHDVVEADRRGEGAGSVDLLDRRQVADSLTDCDAIIHCAGIASPEDVEPAELVHANTMSTFNALEEAWKAGVTTAVLASSGSIYGTAWSPEPLAHPYLPVDELSPLQYVDPYALTKDFLERMGQMYARRGMTVTALRFHWILTADEVRRLGSAAVDTAADEDDARNLWGYVELHDAARACLLALAPRTGEGRFETLVIAAADTRVHRPTDELVDEWFPDTERRTDVRGNSGAFDCSRAAEVLGWTPRPRTPTVYEAVGGGEALLRLARAWHVRVMADEVVSHAFSHGFHPHHSERLAAYWGEALGGPTAYTDDYGDESSVVRLHSGTGPHQEMDRRAIACFDQAMTDVALSRDDPVRAVLHDYFAWATTTTMSRYHHSADEVPDELPMPHWSWDGVQG